MRTQAGLDGIIAELERESIELLRAVNRREPCLAEHILARSKIVLALQSCDFGLASPGQLTRLRAIARLGRSVEDAIRQWRSGVAAQLAALSGQAEMARAAVDREAAGSILDMTI